MASPRRVNPLANKRVEMIKNCEIDLQKQQQQAQSKTRSSELTEQELTAAVNKRIEMLKLETQSPPGSPKLGACSPRKTHLTNFINQNISPEVGLRKNVNSPLVQRRSLSPTPSPLQKRRLVAQQQGNPKTQSIIPNHNLGTQLSDSDQDYHALKTNDHLNLNFLQAHQQASSNEYNDAINHNTIQREISGMGPKTAFNYCPQSEPLKRKVYKSHATLDSNKHKFHAVVVSKEGKYVCNYLGFIK